MAHLACLNSRKTVEKENTPPTKSCGARDSSPSTVIIAQLQIELKAQQQKARTYERRFRSERKRASRRDNAAACLQKQLHSLQTSSMEIAAQAREAEVQRADTIESVNHLKSRNKALTKRNHVLTMRVARASAAKHRAVELAHNRVSMEAAASTFTMKEKGVFTNTSRAMVRNMVANLDVPIRSVNATINAVAEALGRLS